MLCISDSACVDFVHVTKIHERNGLLYRFLARATSLQGQLCSLVTNFCLSIFHPVSKFQIERSGTFQNNQRLCVFVLFQFSTTWLNSTVKGSATDEQEQNRYFGMSVNTAVVAMMFSNTMKLVQQDNSSHNNPGPGTVGYVYSQ